MIGLLEERHTAHHLAHAERLHEHRPDDLEAPLKALRRDGCCAVQDRAQRGAVDAPFGDEVQQHVDHRGYEHDGRDPVPGDRLDHVHRVEPAVDDLLATDHDHRQTDAARAVAQRTDVQDHVVIAQAHVGDLAEPERPPPVV